MTTKKLLLQLTLMLILPFGANAAYTYVYTSTPARVGSNGTVTETSSTGPYQIVTIGDDDDEHIASTAYVKGAYNDTIAAVNRVRDTADRKQSLLVSTDADAGSPYVDSELISADEFVSELADNDLDEMTNFLISAYGVAKGIQSQRVTIYTTWDDDSANATTQVALSTAQ